MNSVEDRVRNATRAIAGTVREVRPLELPPAPARGARGTWRGRWKAWITPLTAAAAVLAVAVALVIVRSIPNGQAVPLSRSGTPSPVPSPYAVSFPLGIPRYYVAFDNTQDDSAPYGAVVSDTFTGTRLATVNPPAHSTFAGITAAADDRTYVLDATSCSRPIASSRTCPRTWYMLALAVTTSGTAIETKLTRLPIPATASGTQVQAMALSPDGSELAVALQPDTSALESLTVYSVFTGTALRTWNGPSGTILNPVRLSRVDSNTPISWLDDGHTLAFSNETTLRLLDTARAGHELIADSRLAWSYPGKGQPRGYSIFCEGTPVVATADGKELVCGATGMPSDTRSVPSKCSAMWDNAMGFLEYSAATGKLARTLYLDQTTCTAEVTADVLWASASGGALIALLNSAQESDPGGPQRNQVGVISHGKFTPLPFRLPVGVLLPNEIAW